MEFEDWLNTIKDEEKELTEFVTSLVPYFSGTGFNASDFEKIVKSRLIHIDELSTSNHTTNDCTN